MTASSTSSTRYPQTLRSRSARLRERVRALASQLESAERWPEVSENPAGTPPPRRRLGALLRDLRRALIQLAVPEDGVEAGAGLLSGRRARKASIGGLHLAGKDGYRAIVDALQEGVVVFDAEAKIRAFNESALRILGLTGRELLVRDVWDPRWKVIREDGSSRPPEESPVIVTLRTGVPTSSTVGVRKADGELAWLAVSCQPLHRPRSAAPYGVVSSFTDVTARKVAEDALAESETRCRLLARATSDAIYDWYCGGDEAEWSEGLERLFGHP